MSFLLKVPRHRRLSRHRGSWRFSAKGEAVFPGDLTPRPERANLHFRVLG